MAPSRISPTPSGRSGMTPGFGRGCGPAAVQSAGSDIVGPPGVRCRAILAGPDPGDGVRPDGRRERRGAGSAPGGFLVGDHRLERGEGVYAALPAPAPHAAGLPPA